MDAQDDSEPELMDEDEFARRFFEQDLSDLPGPDSASEGEPPPARAGRHPAMMVAVMVFSALLMWMFWEDTAYWLSGRGDGPAAAGPVDIGDSVQWKREFEKDPTFAPPVLRHNSYIRVAGLTAYRTESAKSREAFLKIVFLPLYVHLKDEPPSRPSDHLVHLSVSGRVLDLTRTTRYRGVQHFYAENFGLPTRSAFALVVQDKPDLYWWAPLLQLLFMTFIGINGRLLFRALREG